MNKYREFLKRERAQDGEGGSISFVLFLLFLYLVIEPTLQTIENS